MDFSKLSNEDLLEKYEDLLNEWEHGFERLLSEVFNDLENAKAEILSRMK